MRFVFVSTMSGYPWGGSEELWSQAALLLRKEGHEVCASVVWWEQLSPNLKSLANSGIELYTRKSSAQSSLAIRSWKKIQKRLGQTPKEFSWLCLQQPNLVVISQGSNSDGLVWMQFCRDAGIPYVSIVQANWEGWWPTDGMSNALAEAYRGACKAFFVSRRNLELMECQIGESLSNAAVIWNPFNVPTEVPMIWPEINKIWKCACVARLEPAAKGQDVLLQILSQIKWRERPLEVNFYGAGPCENSLKKLANRLKIKNVRFCGHLADVRNIWTENHLLILPSRYEGLPLALVEAMWCGRPAIVTDVGGNADMCVNGKTGFIANAPEVRLFDEAMSRAWDCRNNWQEMGNRARARAELIIPRTPVVDFCKQLVESRKGRGSNLGNKHNP